MTAVDGLGSVDELTDVTGDSMDAYMGKAIGPWKSRLRDARERVGLGRAEEVRRLVFKSVPDAITRAAMLKRGEVDVACLLEVPPAQEVQRDPTLKLAFSGGIALFFLDFLDQWDPESPWAYVWPSGVGPRVEEPARMLINPYPWSAPLEEVRLKKK